MIQALITVLSSCLHPHPDNQTHTHTHTHTYARAHTHTHAGDYTCHAWVFAVWPLLRRIFMSTIVNSTDGALNAGLSVAAQTADSLLLLCMRPYNSKMTNMTEMIGGFSTLSCYLVIALPMLADFAMPEWIGDTTTIILAVFSTAVAACFSLIGPLISLCRLLHYLFRKMTECTAHGGLRKLKQNVSQGAKSVIREVSAVDRGSAVAASNAYTEMQAATQVCTLVYGPDMRLLQFGIRL
jgi:hypothetical protein